MVLEAVISSRSPPRPNSLSLQSSWNDNFQSDSSSAGAMVFGQGQPEKRRKKKRRAADIGKQLFEQLYAPTGETLGSGSQGCVSTYRHILTDVEYAVKVCIILYFLLVLLYTLVRYVYVAM